MRSRIPAIAGLLLALVHPVASAQKSPSELTAPTVVERLLAGRDQLHLNDNQVARLTRLAEQLRHDRGRTIVLGLDRVPGKSVPRITRARPTPDEAFRQAARLLSSDQVAAARQLLAWHT